MTDKKTTLNYNNVECDFSNNILTFKEKDYINIVDLSNNKYIRNNNDYKMEFSFNDNKMILSLLKEKLDFSDYFIGKIENIDNKIYIEYKIDDELKNIIIHLL